MATRTTAKRPTLRLLKMDQKPRAYPVREGFGIFGGVCFRLIVWRDRAEYEADPDRPPPSQVSVFSDGSLLYAEPVPG